VKTYLISEEVLREVLDALDLSQALLEHSLHHKTVLEQYNTLRKILASPPADPVAWTDEGITRVREILRKDL